MERRRLGHSDLDITPIEFWRVGYRWEWTFGWGPQNDQDSLATIRRALDRGINWIDTAAAYGLGHSERVIARALRDVPRGEEILAIEQVDTALA